MRAYSILLFLFALSACGDKKSPTERVYAPAPVEGKAEEKQEKKPENVPQEKTAKKPISYSVENLLEAQQKSFDQLKSKIGEGIVKSVKVWKDGKNIYTTLTVIKPDDSVEAFNYSCHFHGKRMACHAKSEAKTKLPLH